MLYYNGKHQESFSRCASLIKFLVSDYFLAKLGIGKAAFDFFCEQDPAILVKIHSVTDPCTPAHAHLRDYMALG
jgi:hypothetical protein